MKHGMIQRDGIGPGAITFAKGGTTSGDARASQPYVEKYRPDGLGKPQDLAGGHLLSHVQQEPAVAFFNATHQPAELVQKASLFP